jgi:hypothetical protein
MTKRKLKRDDAKARAIAMVADFVEQFDKQVDHPSRLSDCILLKFNLINKRQVRRNPRERAGEQPQPKRGDQ